MPAALLPSYTQLLDFGDRQHDQQENDAPLFTMPDEDLGDLPSEPTVPTMTHLPEEAQTGTTPLVSDKTPERLPPETPVPTSSETGGDGGTTSAPGGAGGEEAHTSAPGGAGGDSDLGEHKELQPSAEPSSSQTLAKEAGEPHLLDQTKTFERLRLGRIRVPSLQAVDNIGARLDREELAAARKRKAEQARHKRVARDLKATKPDGTKKRVTFAENVTEYDGNTSWAFVSWSVEEEPKNYRDAMRSAHKAEWIASMADEIKSQHESGTWQLVPKPPGARVMGSTWVYKIKLEADGSFRRKSRVCAQGFSQKKHLGDFRTTFAPVARITSVRIILAIGARYDLELWHLDVKTAFLNGKPETAQYMRQPAGFEEKGKEDHVCLLLRSLYGTKDAAHCWYKELHSALIAFGFKRCDNDHSLYRYKQGEVVAFLAVWVDDLAIAFRGEGFIERLLKFFREVRGYKMNDLGPLKWVVGLKVSRNRQQRTITLSQETYIGAILKKFGMDAANPTNTPYNASVILSKEQCPTTEKETEDASAFPYRGAVGSLMYAMVATRPDIAASVREVARFMQNPGQTHITAVKRIFRYLKGTKDLGLTLTGKPTSTTLIGWSDADWANCIDTRKSNTAFIFKVFGGTISWKSSRQPTVAVSTTEAEYMSASAAAREASWLRQVLLELALGHPPESPTTIYEDNDGAIALSENPVAHSRNKHIDVKHHYIREQYELGHMELKPIDTKENWADILTKTSIPLEQFQYLRQNILNEDQQVVDSKEETKEPHD